MKKPVFSSLLKYYAEDRGIVIPLTAVGIGLFVTLMGVTTDYARQQVLQSKLAISLDAAALNAAKYLNQKQKLEEELQRYTNANFQNVEQGNPIDFKIKISNDKTRLYVKADAQAKAGFSGFFSKNKMMRISAETTVILDDVAAEIVLTLDNTGSMLHELADLKDAAKDFVKEFIKLNTPHKTVARVGIVPFAESINVGDNNTAFVKNDLNDWAGEKWGGCVDARGNDYDVTEASIATAPYTKFYNPCNSSNDAGNNKWYGNNTDNDNCNTGGKDFKYQKSLDTNLGPNKGCIKAKIIPLTTQLGSLVSEIEQMEAKGGTQIPLGLSWAWNMLSPDWQADWKISTPTVTLPSEYRADTRKFVVLMTDGANVYRPDYHTSYTAMLEERSTASKELDTKTENLCKNMKEKGIVIYTIALGSDINANTLKLLKNCATSPDYAYEIAKSSDLKLQFQDILKQVSYSMSGVRLTGVTDSDRM